jgi:hypothetical protein
LRDFEQSFRGLLWERCYNYRSGESFPFRAGTYTHHGEFRRALSLAALGVDTMEVGADPASFREAPFFELIYFADNEGCIGPLAATDLAADFAEGHDSGVRAKLSDEHQARYDKWSCAFTLASGNGLVHFG